SKAWTDWPPAAVGLSASRISKVLSALHIGRDGFERAGKGLVRPAFFHLNGVNTLEKCANTGATPRAAEIGPNHLISSTNELQTHDGETVAVERTAAPVAQPIGVAASPEIACEAIVCIAAGWSRRTRRSRRCQRCVPE